jgi:hypothetical protein
MGKLKYSPLYTHRDPPGKTNESPVGVAVDNTLTKLGQLPFYCGDDLLHLVDTNYMEKGCCVTHIVGLPKHAATQLEMPLTEFQLDFVKQVINEVTNPGKLDKEAWDRLHHAFHINKGRQMGFTEIVLRIIQYFCFNRYAGKNIGIMAATNGGLANKDLRRFYRLFNNIKHVLTGPIKAHKLEINNGCIIEAFPASEEAMTGDTNYAAIFLDEAAKWKLVDDTPVFNSIMPIVRSNGADLFLVSTPKGPLKMFYKIWKDPQEFVKLEYDIWHAEGNIYTHDQIIELLKSTKEDPNQEYLCKFTIGEHSILGAITDADRDPNLAEWGAPDPEDDGYTEPDDGLKDDE